MSHNTSEHEHNLTLEEELILIKYAIKVGIPHKVLLHPFSEREKNLLQIMAILVSQYFALDDLCKSLLKKRL